MKPNKIEHIGIAVFNIDEAIRYWEDIMGLKCYNIEEVVDQKVKTAFSTPMRRAYRVKDGGADVAGNAREFCITFQMGTGPKFLGLIFCNGRLAHDCGRCVWIRLPPEDRLRER